MTEAGSLFQYFTALTETRIIQPEIYIQKLSS